MGCSSRSAICASTRGRRRSPGSTPGTIRRWCADPGVANVDELTRTGLPLGIEADSPFGEGTTSLEAGDFIVMYTDGLTEGADSSDEEFGTGTRPPDPALDDRELAGEILVRILEFAQRIPGRHGSSRRCDRARLAAPRPQDEAQGHVDRASPWTPRFFSIATNS